MKKTSLLIVLALVAVLAFTACGKSGDGASGGEKETTAAAETQVPGGDTAEFPAPAKDVAVTIELGDFDGMEALGKQISNFELDDKTVKVTGEVDKLGSSWCIQEPNADKTEYKGYSIRVQGWADSDYPAHGTVVEIVGVVVADGLSHYIAILPENFTVK
ncbi:MAG: hypothetical protein MJ092_04860 [Lachnospiraceae bacterium]|nr:hypothetical protein [Lachnospiraceae bacterium]